MKKKIFYNWLLIVVSNYMRHSKIYFKRFHKTSIMCIKKVDIDIFNIKCKIPKYSKSLSCKNSYFEAKKLRFSDADSKFKFILQQITSQV